MQKALLVIWNWYGFNYCLSIWIHSIIPDTCIYYNCMGFSVKNYALKWVMQRITASLLIPLTFWFIYSAISLSKMEYDETISFFQSYLNSLLFYVMMIAMLLHAKLGLQTIIDDYVTSKKIYKLSKWGINLTSYFLMILLTIFIIKTAIFNV